MFFRFPSHSLRCDRQSIQSNFIACENSTVTFHKRLEETSIMSVMVSSYSLKKFWVPHPPTQMERGGEDKLESVRRTLSALTFQQLLIVLAMISDELAFRFQSYRWQKTPGNVTPSPPRGDPQAKESDGEWTVNNDGSTASESSWNPAEGPREPEGPPPGWTPPPWKKSLPVAETLMAPEILMAPGFEAAVLGGHASTLALAPMVFR